MNKPAAKLESSKPNGYSFYSRPEYYQDLTARISNAKKGDRIAVATMGFKPSEPAVSVIMEALSSASQRGVTVRLMVDSYAFMKGPLLFTQKMPRWLKWPLAKKFAALETLAANGGDYTITNRPSQRISFPFAGRSHMKFAVINERVYVGGCNLTETNQIDLMVSWQQPAIADRLFRLAADVRDTNNLAQALHNTDVTIPADNQSHILIDAGLKNQSLIFKTALQIIDEARNYIVLSCQYSPNSVTAQHLSRAVERGVTVRLIYNHPSKHTFPFNVLQTAVKYFEKRKNQASLFSYELPKNNDFLHAKLLATDQACIVGSHNYVQAGVSFGTAEIAVMSTDVNFAAQAIKAFDRQLK